MVEPALHVPLRAVVAGCGGISRWTLDVARQSKEFQVVALQDVDAAAIKTYGDQFGIERRSTKLEELVNDQVDIVIINTPNHLHLEQAELALHAGKHCLVQKPMTRSLKEAEQMAKLAERKGLKLGITMMELGNPLNYQIKAMVQAGVIGAPCLWQSAHAHDFFLRQPPAPTNWRRDAEKVGGASFIQLAVHHCNLAMWLLDQPIVTVSALSGAGHTVFKRDETTIAAVSFRQGVVGSFTSSYATSGVQIAIHGTEGHIRMFNDTLLIKGVKTFQGELFNYLQPGQEMVVRVDALRGAMAKLQAGNDVHNRFARWVVHNEPFPCPAADGVRDMKIVEAVYQSLEKGITVHV